MRQAAILIMVVLCGAGLLLPAAADPEAAGEPGIEDEVEQCRKDCIETTCAPQLRTCLNSSGEVSQTCKTLREDCEKRCVEIDCMT